MRANVFSPERLIGDTNKNVLNTIRHTVLIKLEWIYRKMIVIEQWQNVFLSVILPNLSKHFLWITSDVASFRTRNKFVYAKKPYYSIITHTLCRNCLFIYCKANMHKSVKLSRYSRVSRIDFIQKIKESSLFAWNWNKTHASCKTSETART